MKNNHRQPKPITNQPKPFSNAGVRLLSSNASLGSMLIKAFVSVY
jgi:hypothetical protein